MLSFINPLHNSLLIGPLVAFSVLLVIMVIVVSWLLLFGVPSSPSYSLFSGTLPALLLLLWVCQEADNKRELAINKKTNNPIKKMDKGLE